MQKKGNLTNEQKYYLINISQELYRKFLDVRKDEDPIAWEIDPNTLKEACRDISMLVHYIAKNEYNIDDINNRVFHCIFKYNGKSSSHFFNKIYDTIVDSTIMQFDNLSPYETYDENYYTEQEEEEIDYSTITNEIDCYEVRQHLKQSKRSRQEENNEKIKSKWVENILNKFFR